MAHRRVKHRGNKPALHHVDRMTKVRADAEFKATGIFLPIDGHNFTA